MGGAQRQGKFSSLGGKHAPSIKYYDSVTERHLQGKVFYFVPSFQNSMRESSSGAENYIKKMEICAAKQYLQ